MTDHQRITRLVTDAATHLVPDQLDLWPAIREQGQPAPRPAAHRKGRLAWTAGLIGVLLVGIAFILIRDDGGRSLRTSSLNQALTPTVSPTVTVSEVPSDTLTTSEATPLPDLGLEDCTQNIGFDSRVILYAEPDVNSERLFQTLHENASMRLWGSQKIDGVMWYDVGLRVLQGNFRGWVTGHPSYFTACEGSAIISTRITYDVLGMPVQVPADMLLFHDSGLNRPDRGVVTASFALEAGDIHPFDPTALPPHGLVIEVLRVLSVNALGLDPSAPIDTAQVLTALLGSAPDLSPDWSSTFVLQSTPLQWTIFMLFAPPGSDMQVLNETVFYPMLESAGIFLPQSIFVESADFSDEGIYTHTDELTRDAPRHDYYVFGLKLPDATRLGAMGYVSVSVHGEEYTPNLYVERRENTGQRPSQYRTNDGVLLVPWTKTEAAQTDQYVIIVEGNIQALRGGYTLAIRPISDVLYVGQGEQSITLGCQQSRYIRYTRSGTKPLRLTISDVQANGWGDTPAPDVAVVLPDGVTLTRFNPSQTPQLALDFVSSPTDFPLILFSPLDAGCTEGEGEIALTVSVGASPALNGD